MSGWLVGQLPVGMVEDDFLVRFVTMLQQVADSVIGQVDTMQHLFDTSVAPDQMVRELADWIALDWVDPSLPVHLQRRIVANYGGVLQWRGTRRGLQQLLEVISGAPAQVTDSGGVFVEGAAPRAQPHVRMDVVGTGWMTEQDLVRIVRAELPAAVTFDLWVGDRLVASFDDREKVSA